jgi:hypothetical protein
MHAHRGGETVLSKTTASTLLQGKLDGTCFSRISPGEYVQAGRQGARRQGEVEGVAGLTVRAAAEVEAGR